MIPKKIDVLSTIFDVIICDKPSDVGGDNGGSPWGTVNLFTSEIKIYKHKSEDQALKSFYHEICHCIIEKLQITEIKKSERYEDIVESFSEVFVDTLIRNKLIGWKK